MKDKELFTVVVADDEDELREAVCSLVPWESIGFRLVGSAGNGLDALQLVEQLQPDLLLTDIHMPFISGTALAKQVRELQPLIQIAFLSGYDDFEYAKLAIEYEVITYLLKPISMNDLTAALRELRAKMEAKFSYLASGADAGGGLQLAVASLLLDGFAEPPAEHELQRSLSELGLVVTAPYELTALALRMEDGSVLEQSAAQTVDKVLRKYFGCCSIVSGERILTLLVSEDGFSRLGTALDELLQVVRRLLDSGCSIGVSRRYSEFSRCHAACREAVDAQRFSGENGIHRISDMLSLPSDAPPAPDAAAELEKLLHGESRYPLEKYLSKTLPPDRSPPESAGDAALLQTLVAAQNVLANSLPANELALLLKRCGLTDPLSAGLGRDELRRRVADLCISGYGLLEERRRDGVSHMCDRTMRMIEQNYMDEELSLGSVSEQLHVSPNYLSANMKKYAGDTFINLLIKKRMEVALALLSAGGMKIAEVSSRCGYSDQHYFSFCFKKYYGVSPARMRRGDGKEEGA